MSKYHSKGEAIRLKVSLPDSLNKFINKCWQARMREKDDLCEEIYLSIWEQTKLPIPKWEKATIKYTIHSSRITDADNRIVIVKIINDCIVRSELLPDDSPKHLTYDLPDFVKDKERYVLVEIVEV